MENNSNNQSVVTMYTVIGDFGRIKHALTMAFADVLESVEKAQAEGTVSEAFALKCVDGITIDVFVNYAQCFMKPHISGMHGFFAQVKCDNDELHQSVLAQIRVFNCVCGITFSADTDEQLKFIIEGLFGVAKELNAIMLTADMRLLNSDGMLIFSADGKSDFTEYRPIGNADYINSTAEVSPADESRRQRSIAALEQKGVPYIKHLPLAALESEAAIRTPQEIAERLVAMFAVCVYSEARGAGESWDDCQKYLATGDDILGGRLDVLLTPNEKAYLAQHQPDQQLVVNFSWRYECCHVLTWALGLIDELGYPDSTCDVSSLAGLLLSQNNLDNLLKNAKPRAKDEILDAADLILRYDWACVDARINGRPMPANLNGGVVYEWHYALNWLIGYMNADWDSISTDT